MAPCSSSKSARSSPIDLISILFNGKDASLFLPSSYKYSSLPIVTGCAKTGMLPLRAVNHALDPGLFSMLVLNNRFRRNKIKAYKSSLFVLSYLTKPPGNVPCEEAHSFINSKTKTWKKQLYMRLRREKSARSARYHAVISWVMQVYLLRPLLPLVP